MISQTTLPEGNRAGAALLCVDDDNMVLAFMKLVLEKNGFSVHTAANWRCALDIFRENPIDLVMVDYEMPDMKGHELAVWIRSLKPEVPILLHSSSSDVPEIAIKVTDAVIPKGVEPCVLIASISNLIMRSRVSRSYRHA
jgi:DNA-binding response OmpR family regulator